MNIKLVLLLGLLCLLAWLALGRGCGGSGDDYVEAEVALRYLVCTNCGAQYEIPADYFTKVDDADIHRRDTTVSFRCRKCGEIAAQPGMQILLNGEVAGVSGAQYDEGRGIDEM